MPLVKFRYKEKKMISNHKERNIRRSKNIVVTYMINYVYMYIDIEEIYNEEVYNYTVVYIERMGGSITFEIHD